MKLKPEGSLESLRVPHSAKVWLDKLAKDYGISYTGTGGNGGWRAAHAALMQGYFTLTPRPRLKTEAATTAPLTKRPAASRGCQQEPETEDPIDRI